MTYTVTHAIQLAEGILARSEAQPVDLSASEARLLAKALISYVKPRVGSDDPIGATYSSNTVFLKDIRIERLFDGKLEHMNFLKRVLESDREAIIAAEQTYGASWKLRGGTGAFHVMARKWDRLDTRCENLDYNIFRAIAEDRRREGAIDDLRDLRRYLALIECEMVNLGAVQIETETKDTVTNA